MDTMEEKKKALLSLLIQKSYKYCSDPPFTLASGKRSPYYIDCKPTTNNSEGLARIGEIFYDLISEIEVDAIGGLTMGADPIAHATSLVGYQRGKPINAFCVRKMTKDHGLSKIIEGDVRSGDRVVVVDDVITTGGSTIEAIQKAKDFGLKIVKVIVLVDREEGGKQAIERHVRPVESIFTLSELKEYFDNERVSSERTLQRQLTTADPAL